MLLVFENFQEGPEQPSKTYTLWAEGGPKILGENVKILNRDIEKFLSKNGEKH